MHHISANSSQFHVTDISISSPVLFVGKAWIKVTNRNGQHTAPNILLEEQHIVFSFVSHKGGLGSWSLCLVFTPRWFPTINDSNRGG